MTEEAIYLRIKQKLLENKLSVTQLSKLIGASHTTVNRHLSGAKISDDYLQSYSKALRCKYNWLRYGIETEETLDPIEINKALNSVKIEQSHDICAMELMIKSLLRIERFAPKILNEKEILAFCTTLYKDLSLIKDKNKKEQEYKERTNTQIDALLSEIRSSLKNSLK